MRDALMVGGVRQGKRYPWQHYKWTPQKANRVHSCKNLLILQAKWPFSEARKRANVKLIINQKMLPVLAQRQP